MLRGFGLFNFRLVRLRFDGVAIVLGIDFPSILNQILFVSMRSSNRSPSSHLGCAGCGSGLSVVVAMFMSKSFNEGEVRHKRTRGQGVPWCGQLDSNQHGITRGILSPLRLPFRHARIDYLVLRADLLSPSKTR